MDSVARVRADAPCAHARWSRRSRSWSQLALPSPAAAARSHDMDRDGLGNAFEQTATLTNPRLGDTDRDGVSDGAEDPDADGLPNLAEQAAGAHPRARRHRR